MRKIILIIFLILTLLAGCKKTNEAPSKTIMLYSYVFDGLRGFYFETGTIIRYPVTNNPNPDFSVLPQIDQTGVIGPFLSNPDFTLVFALTNSFSDKESADRYFDNYTTASTTTYDLHALNLKPYQIWTIKTNKGRLAKILVLDTQKGTMADPWAEVTFRWDFIE